MQREEIDAHHMQARAPGFHMVWLPYADDMRKLAYDRSLPRASDVRACVLLRWALCHYLFRMLSAEHYFVLVAHMCVRGDVCFVPIIVTRAECARTSKPSRVSSSATSFAVRTSRFESSGCWWMSLRQATT